MDFNIQERLKNLSSEDKRKMKVLGIAGLVITLLFFLIFQVIFPSDEDKEVTEIEVPNAQEVQEYNSKLDAINNKNNNVAIEDDMNKYFEKQDLTDPLQQNIYSNEDKKVDSLMNVFENENKVSKGTFYSANTQSYTKGNVSQSQPQQRSYQRETNTYSNNHNNESVSYNSNYNNQPAERKLTADEQAELRRQKRLEQLRGTNQSSQVSNQKTSTVQAVIRGSQNLKNGQSIALNNTQDMFINGVKIPKNTYIYGNVNFSSNKAEIRISSINLKGQIIPCEIEVYALNGTKGIDIKIDETTNNLKGSAVREGAEQVGGVYGRASRIVTDGLKGKATETKVTFVDNQKILLVVK